jgi:hypothetical protein
MAAMHFFIDSLLLQLGLSLLRYFLFLVSVKIILTLVLTDKHHTFCCSKM